jgi:hypothetical protein
MEEKTPRQLAKAESSPPPGPRVYKVRTTPNYAHNIKKKNIPYQAQPNGKY